MRRLALVLIGIAIAAATGCGEKPQTVSYKDGRYRGKPDTRPWDNSPLSYGSPDWKKGDEQTWDDGVRQRTLTQNEYGRIAH